jgi:F0F1-type ATP synthase assembly protein I
MKTPKKVENPAAGLVQGQIGFSLALSAGLDLAVFIVLGVWADRKFGTTPLWTLVGVGVGLASAVAVVFVMARLANAKPKDQ